MVLSDSFYYQPVQIDTINTRVNADIFAKEGDANGRGMVVQITENGIIKDTTGITLRLQWSHLSVGVSGFREFEVVDASKGLYKVKYPTSMLHRGRVEAFIRITDNGILSGTRNLMITVERMVGSDETIEASDDFSALQTALIQLDAWNVTIGRKVDTWETDMEATKQLYIDTLAATEAGYPQELVSLKSELADTKTKTDSFVTPQMFGAKGDGITDDTVALQAAINYGIANKKTVLLFGTYVIKDTLTINKTVSIMGVDSHAIITTPRSGMYSFFTIEGTEGVSKTNTEDGKYISIKNIKITCPNTTNTTYGIVYNDCFVTYNELDNLIFEGLNNPCIYLNSVTGYLNLGVYSHNINWNHIYTFGCSSIVGQATANGTQPYIYGGVINDIHFEGLHKADANGNAHILDLKGFRNVRLSDIIIEGTLQALKRSCLRLTYSCDIENIYFEFGSGSIYPSNLMRIESVPASKMYIKGFMGNFYAPIYLQKCDLTIHLAYMTNPGLILGNAELVLDASSYGHKLTFDNGYYGRPWIKTDNKRIVPRNISHNNIALDSTLTLNIDDTPPLLSVDLAELVVGAHVEAKYNNLVYIWEPSGYAGTTLLTPASDYFLGNRIVLKATGTTPETNFLRCGIFLNLALLPVEIGEYVTVVMTVKPNVTPANGNTKVGETITQGVSANKYYQVPESDGAYGLCYGSKLKQVNDYFTLIHPIQKYEGGNYTFKFDVPITDEYCDVVQEYTVVDFTVFKGLHYGSCTSKLITDGKKYKI